MALAAPIAATSTPALAANPAQSIIINGKVQNYGPLAPLIGTWKTVPSTGVDVAPGQTGSDVGKGKSTKVVRLPYTSNFYCLPGRA